MDNFKGTPGPWRYEANAINSISIVANDFEVCSIYSDNEEDLLTEDEWSNARLIASAPELLEALQKAKQLICSLKLSMLTHPDCTQGSEFDDYTSSAEEFEDNAESVINKALGKEVDNG